MSLHVSDEITGEDGLVEFDGGSEDGKVLYDGLGLTLTSGPLSRVDVSAEFTWTQQARGTVDLTNYLISHWPESARWPNPINAGQQLAEARGRPRRRLGSGGINRHRSGRLREPERTRSQATLQTSRRTGPPPR